MLEEQLRFSKTQNAQLIEQNTRQAEPIGRMASQIETLTASVHSLEQALLSRDASFIAGILQLRYIYSMPVERIIKFFGESGFDINKSTAHGLIKKTAWLFDPLEQTLGRQSVRMNICIWTRAITRY